MASVEHPLYIITGTSGTGIEESLTRYIQRYDARARVIRLEHKLVEVARTVLGNPSVQMIELFSEPEGVLRDLWIDAMGAACEEVTQALKEGPVFFRLNAAWYHVASGGFVSGLHVRSLTRLPTPSRVITLIDDMADVLARLRRRRKLFEEIPGETLTSLALKVLAWRELEVRNSQQMALSFAGIPHYLFPVKHPLLTFERLLRCKREDVLYLSHPISAIRRDLYAQQQKFEDFLDVVARQLRCHRSIVLLEPTAIDEWRLERDKGTGKVLSRTLRSRWRTPRSNDDAPLELLATELNEEERDFVQQPFEYSNEPLEALTVLSSEIRKHVSWRDRMMVEQAARVFVIRPFASDMGRLSGGVYEETHLHQRLRAYYAAPEVKARHADRPDQTVVAPRRSRPIVYHTPEDEHRRQVGSIVAVIAAYGELGRVRGWRQDDPDETKEALRRQLQDQPINEWCGRTPHEVGELVDDALRAVRTGLHVSGQTSGSTLDVSSGLGRRDETLRRIGEDTIAAVRGRSPLAPEYSLDHFLDCEMLTNDLNAEELGDAVVGLLPGSSDV